MIAEVRAAELAERRERRRAEAALADDEAHAAALISGRVKRSIRAEVVVPMQIGA